MPIRVRLRDVGGHIVVFRRRNANFVAAWPSGFSPSANRVLCEEDSLTKRSKNRKKLTKVSKIGKINKIPKLAKSAKLTNSQN